MSKEIFAAIEGEARNREDASYVARATEMANVYEGNLPQRFDKFFPKNTPRQTVNVIRTAWDDLATSAGRIPEFRVDTTNETSKELKAAGLLEKIAHAKLRDSQPSAASFMWEFAWWLVGTGRSIAVVKPDFENQRPEMQVRDPRTARPRAKKMSGNTITVLADIIFTYDIPSKSAVAMGLAPAVDGEGNMQKTTKVVELIDDQAWTLASQGGTVQRWEHGLGVVPAVVPQMFSPESMSGLGLFDDQVSLMVSMSRLMSQKMAYADRLVNPVTWVKGHEGDINIGPTTVMRLSAQGQIGQLSPPTTLQVDQDIAMLERFSRVLNRNPEARTGEVQSKGSYTSAKTLEQLSEAIDTVIGRYWDVMGNAMTELVGVALMMEEKLWPDVEKSIFGTMKGKRFSASYVPSKDVKGRYFVRADYGFGIGGYQGFLQHLQAQQSGTMSRRRAMEAMPGVSDVDEELRTIELEQMDEAGNQMFLQKAMAGQLDAVVWAKVRKDMAEDRLPLHEVILKYETALQAQAQAAVQSQGDVGGLTTPEQGPLAEEAPQPPGIPAAVLG